MLPLWPESEQRICGPPWWLPLLRQMLPDARFESRQRMSVLSFAGSKKLTRLPRRSAIVAFGTAEVYQIA